MMKNCVIIVFCICAAFGWNTCSEAAEFGPDSAVITNKYFTLYPGVKGITQGYGTLNGHYDYSDVLGTEIVSGVVCQCILSVDTYNEWFQIVWAAQDINGDVYFLKLFDPTLSEPIEFGLENAFLIMPADLQVGDTIFNDDTVIEVGATVDRLTTGLGPFTDCVKVREEDGDIKYYAPGFGQVKKEYVGDYGGKELKEIIWGASSAAVYITHITAGSNNWTDRLHADNIGAVSAGFTITLFGNGEVVYSGHHTIPGMSKIIIDLKSLSEEAETGIVTFTETGLSFRLSNENDKGGVAEFKLSGDLWHKIGLYFTDYASKGAAIANFSGTPANVSLYALGQGMILDTCDISIGAFDRIVGVYTAWFPQVSPDMIDAIMVVSSAPTLSGEVICGDADGSHLLFGTASPATAFSTD